ncbi:hypothetical protein LCGC14_2508750 [marine sediment metagenome]|uniref:Uncharacterized protein n=1 Tax=marine sediment metagenome TaxID=412755 RepID=A0A0F9AZR2_9ZZZZ
MDRKTSDEKKEKKKARKFLWELFKLCKKYDATIGGCGCCGSPRVSVGKWDAEDLVASPKELKTDEGVMFDG